mmetsp:Transcript_8706/g.9620  ORF Transcript_8706/g.9620 Transcript_8706/m.9620 type:complete len:606 (-) Transcript_8706:64-1881(-)|eukprot:CAMPEP_0194147248 /NCGR_PEP_ID=MMETSP0152-20130528/22610_1 /TAXON_ID=1049557 /ORGANISM="Thalassiothrix antarctica, Strain L6-D1" /LENGTH=605 /DNA_ID=CAMNT_0038847967 /DNA_START=166 /DNA_END=1983 /DNA_ORIENTATION=+
MKIGISTCLLQWLLNVTLLQSLFEVTYSFVPSPRNFLYKERLNAISEPLDEETNNNNIPTLVQVEDIQDSPPNVDSNTFYDIDNEDDKDDLEYERDEDDILTEREDRLFVHTKLTETCILVGVENLSEKYKARSTDTSPNPEEWNIYFSLDESLAEMNELIRTAGMECVDVVTQNLQQVNPRTYIGTGKVKEIEEVMNKHNCNTVVFDAELSPGQQKALENNFNKELLQNDFMASEREIKVVDRTALILDIFAQHAKTREGKLQVDLALHEYRKPRLTKMWTHLERQSGSGGVGLRGPGESQLEIDRRLVRDRIIVLKKKIDKVRQHRAIHRKGRDRTKLPVLSLVGYTNAGKSTLLNQLTNAGALAHDMLFATLDPTTRKVKLPGCKTHPEVLLTDTVGFIQKLPTNLVAAFRATLEEVQEADVLVHVVDVSSPVWTKQERAVRQVLAEIKASDKPIVTVFNKIDLLSSEDAEYLRYEAACNDLQVAVSSITGDGLVDFVATVEEAMSGMLTQVELLIPYSQGQEMNMIHEVGAVETIEYQEKGTYVYARVPKSLASRLDQYSLVSNEDDLSESKKDAEKIDWVAIGRGRHTMAKDDNEQLLDE